MNMCHKKTNKKKYVSGQVNVKLIDLDGILGISWYGE
jgi:hypothetical protein